MQPKTNPWSVLFLSLHMTTYPPNSLKKQLVELKNGETFNGHLVNCDNFMNITLREVYQTNPDGDRFWKLKECYIRGSTVRFSYPFSVSSHELFFCAMVLMKTPN